MRSCAGKGAVYAYDAIGSYERVGYACQGSGKELVQPALDNRLKAASPLVLPPKVVNKCSMICHCSSVRIDLLTSRACFLPP